MPHCFQLCNKFKQLLDFLKVKYEQQKRIGKYFADFYLPDENLVIEIDGSYWHQNRIEDKIKDIFLLSNGFKVIRLNENDVELLRRQMFRLFEENCLDKSRLLQFVTLKREVRE